MQNLTKLKRVFIVSVAAAFAVVFFSLDASAQASASAKVATIKSDAFFDAAAGIKRVSKVQTTVGNEYKPRVDELNGMIAQYETLRKEVDAMKSKGNYDPAVLTSKTEVATRLSRDIGLKNEVLSSDFEKRSRALMAPLMVDLEAALAAYSKKNKIDLVVDLSKCNIYSFGAGYDITAAFIADYNAANPVQ